MNFRFRMRWNGTGLCAGIATAYKCNGLTTGAGGHHAPRHWTLPLAPCTSLGNNTGAVFVPCGFRTRPFRRKRRSPKHRSHRGIATMDTMDTMWHIAAYLDEQRPA
jgi:hypothetical protein